MFLPLQNKLNTTWTTRTGYLNRLNDRLIESLRKVPKCPNVFSLWFTIYALVCLFVSERRRYLSYPACNIWFMTEVLYCLPYLCCSVWNQKNNKKRWSQSVRFATCFNFSTHRVWQCLEYVKCNLKRTLSSSFIRYTCQTAHWISTIIQSHRSNSAH